MNHYVKIVLALSACLALTTAQYGPYPGFSDFSASFGSSYNLLSSAGSRDPRANPGPVLFPPSPPVDGSDTTGVVVGASGYGFVPPGSRGNSYGR